MSPEKPDTALELDAERAGKQTIDRQTIRPTVGQIEREVSQKIQALYKKMLSHQLGRVTCQLFGSRIAIVLEGSMSRPVKLLLEESQTELAQQICSDLSVAMQPHIKDLLAAVLDVEVLDVLSDATLDTTRTSVIGVLSCPPSVRNPDTIPDAIPDAMKVP